MPASSERGILLFPDDTTYDKRLARQLSTKGSSIPESLGLTVGYSTDSKNVSVTAGIQESGGRAAAERKAEHRSDQELGAVG